MKMMATKKMMGKITMRTTSDFWVQCEVRTFPLYERKYIGGGSDKEKSLGRMTPDALIERRDY